ncbi:MAG: alpha/beta hydrolase-fold protein [Bacteroides sp.]|nr:alpha/beta hydrolase-fold protein [Bacteroides sp.]MCM1084759.1 alpha/beta hydrolase-fold protein [Bacteroides sp.]
MKAKKVLNQCIVWVLSVLLPFIVPAQNLSHTRTYVFHSKVYGKERSFRISVPSNAPTGVKFNLLYVLDADYLFDVASSTAIYMQACDLIPPTAVVAVDYDPPGDKINNIGWNENDFSLYESGQNLYRYINDEIVPFVDLILPSSGFRTIMGHSHTANYLTYYLQANNTNFQSYLLISPDPCWWQRIEDSMPVVSIGSFPFPKDFTAKEKQQEAIIRIIQPTQQGSMHGQIDHRGNYPTLFPFQEAPLEGMHAYDSLLCDGLQNTGFKDVKLLNVPSTYWGVIPDGIPVGLRSLYERYWNIDSLDRFVHASRINNPINPPSGTNVWDFFEKLNREHIQKYHQPLRLSSSIWAFPRRAIENKDTVSLRKLWEYYTQALSVSFPESDALSAMGYLGWWQSKDQEAIEFYERELALDASSGKDFNNNVWSTDNLLIEMLCQTGDLNRAWELLEQVKSVTPPGARVAACYQQGLISARFRYRMCEGIQRLQEALAYPAEIRRWVGCNAGASPEVAEMALEFLKRNADCRDSANTLVRLTNLRYSPYAPAFYESKACFYTDDTKTYGKSTCKQKRNKQKQRRNRKNKSLER